MNILFHRKSRLFSYSQNLLQLSGLLFATVLTSCGGGGGASGFSVGGNVAGLQGSVVLRNNNTDTVTIHDSGTFSFDGRLNEGEQYSVDIITQPLNQQCTILNGDGAISNQDVIDIEITCGEIVTLSGSYQAAPLIQVDSDINDQSAKANKSNDTFLDAQTIPNFSTVHGFATERGTGRIIDNDRFASSEDEFDVYRVNLQKNQTIRLQVVDFAGEDVFQGDLDLVLLDASIPPDPSIEPDPSVGEGEFENLTVLADGDYYIVVNAFTGSSKYTLSINAVSKDNLSAQGSSNIRPGEAVVKFKENAELQSDTTNRVVMNNQQMQLSHNKTTRATLAKFDVTENKKLSSLGQVKAKLTLMDELKQRNFAAFQKLKTFQEIKKLNQRDDVEYAEPNYIYKAQRVPDDEFYNLQWHYPAINLPQAWDITTGARAGSDVIVAVADTGVFLSHPELTNQLVQGYDFISDIDNAGDGDGIDPNPDDPGDSAQLNNSSWHGTHVAGTIAAQTNNDAGVAGVAWQAKIMPLRVLGTEGGSSFDIIQAVRYAAGLPNDSGTVPTQKADIINLSLGGPGSSQASQAAYTAARAEGVIIVAAAGNENTSQLGYPASYDGVISVSATGFDDLRAPYSNFGSTVDVAAPGGSQGVDLNNDGFGDGVLSTLVDDSSGSREPTFKFYQGTSMATPHVAGVLALMRAVHPTLSPDDVDSLLVSGVITTDLGSPGRDDTFGYGLIDALKAVQEAQKLANGGVLPPLPPLIVAQPKELTLGYTNGATLVVSNASTTPAQVTGVNVDSSWLSVSEGTVDADKLGDYQVVIDRTGLGDSFYFGTITFDLSTGESLQVQVSMTVGMVDTEGDAGTIYLLLVDSENKVIDQASVVERGNGVFDYSFANASAGSYRIIGGSDVDNDGFICQLAEACGGYPTINDLSTIEVTDSNVTELNFVVDILANFGAGNILGNNPPTSGSFITDKIGSTGIRRIVNQVSDTDQELTPSKNKKQLIE